MLTSAMSAIARLGRREIVGRVLKSLLEKVYTSMELLNVGGTAAVMTMQGTGPAHIEEGCSNELKISELWEACNIKTTVQGTGIIQRK